MRRRDGGHLGVIVGRRDLHHVRADQALAGAAKRVGRMLPLRPDWEEVKVRVMETVLRTKFHDPDLRARLLATGEADLVEGNHWGDKFWGVCAAAASNQA